MGQAEDDRRKGHREFPTVQEHPDTQEGVLPTGSLFLSPDNKEWDKGIKNVHGWVKVKSQLDGPSGQCGGLNPLPSDYLPPSLPPSHGAQHPGSPRNEKFPSTGMPDTPIVRTLSPLQGGDGEGKTEDSCSLSQVRS